MSFPSITIAIPTYNRSRWLGETLASLADHLHHLKEVPPLLDVEVLVIDNRSTDATPTVAAPYVAAHAGWRYLVEEEQGLDHGRNRAVREARGEILIFLDDDVLLRPNWFTELVAPFALTPSGEKPVAAVGGTVIPVFPEGCPEWLSGWATPLSFGEKSGPITIRQMPMGANLAFRRSIFTTYGLFRTDLDRKGESLLSGGETEMLKRLHRAGEPVWFAPEAAVEHQFPRTRMNLRYTSRHSFDSARSRVLEYVTDPTRSRGTRILYCLSRPLLHLVKAIPLLIVVLISLLIGKGDRLKKTLLRLSRCGGYLYQGLRSLPRAFKVS